MSEAGSGVLPVPVSRSWSEGWQWIRGATLLFRTRPGVWIPGAVLFFVLLFGVNEVPLLGTVASSLLSPVLSAGFIAAFARADAGETIAFRDLFAGFRRKTGALLAVGGWFLLAEVLLLVLVGGAGFLLAGIDLSELLDLMEAGEAGPHATLLALMALAFMLLVVPLLMAYWFAPALVILDEMPVMQAFRLSFDGCMLNIPPFLWYGLVATLLFVIATLPMFLGWLVLGPILLGSQYTAYKSIFCGPRGMLLS